jgi:hypothetical protein
VDRGNPRIASVLPPRLAGRDRLRLIQLDHAVLLTFRKGFPEHLATGTIKRGYLV